MSNGKLPIRWQLLVVVSILKMKWQNCLVTILTFLQGVELSSAGSRAGEWGELGSGSDKFNDDLRFTTALAWFSCVN